VYQPIRGGTAFSDILLDESAVLRLQKGLPPAGAMDEDMGPSQDDIDAQLYQNPDDMCSPNRLKMNMAMPTSSTMIEEEPDIEIALLDE
jgi:hypothetical protein